jgi:CCR4-NOT transcription complex subunit 2
MNDPSGQGGGGLFGSLHGRPQQGQQLPTAFSTLSRSQSASHEQGGQPYPQHPSGPSLMLRGSSTPLTSDLSDYHLRGGSGGGGGGDFLSLISQGGGSRFGGGGDGQGILGQHQQQQQQQQQQQHVDASPSFNMTDFPALSAGMSGLNLGGGGGGLAGFDQHGDSGDQSELLSSHVRHHIPTTSQPLGFAIQSEDFPALPGSGGGLAGEVGGGTTSSGLDQFEGRGLDQFGSVDERARFDPSSGGNLGTIGSNSGSGMGLGMGRGGGPAGGHVAQQQGQSQGQQGAKPPMPGGPVGGAGPGGEINDDQRKYGLLGLLGVIRMTDPDLNMLALGSDLTTLGLNLDSSDVLYATFASPWADAPSTRKPQFNLPLCYYMQPPALKTSHLSKIQLETLFYIFYAMPRDVLQAYSAQELYRRDWRYHGELKLWFKRAAGSSAPGNGVQFIYFDHSTWERRGFTGNIGINVTQGLLSEEEIQVKFGQNTST